MSYRLRVDGEGSLHHDGNTDIGMGGLVVPQRVEKYLYNGAWSIVTKFNHRRLKLAIIQSEWEIV